MLNASISQVNLGTSKAFRNDATDRTIWVKGDGEVETTASDRFSSNDQIQSVREPRLNRFYLAEQKLRTEVTSEDDARQRVADLAHQTLGEGWSVVNVMGRLNSVSLSHTADGVTQKLSVENRENPVKISLRTDLIEDRCHIAHSIDVTGSERIQPDTAVESAYLTFYQ